MNVADNKVESLKRGGVRRWWSEVGSEERLLGKCVAILYIPLPSIFR